MPDICHEISEFAILTCKKDPFDPMEKALVRLSDGDFGKTEHIHRNWELIQEYPLSPDLLAMSNVWRSPDGNDFIIAAKGAPEAIIDLCHFDTAQKTDIEHQIDRMAAEGLRVLGIAKASFSKHTLPDGQHDFTFTFLGLVGFADPVRPHVGGHCRMPFRGYPGDHDHRGLISSLSGKSLRSPECQYRRMGNRAPE